MAAIDRGGIERVVSDRIHPLLSSVADDLALASPPRRWQDCADILLDPLFQSLMVHYPTVLLPLHSLRGTSLLERTSPKVVFADHKQVAVLVVHPVHHHFAKKQGVLVAVGLLAASFAASFSSFAVTFSLYYVTRFRLSFLLSIK